MQHFRGFFCVNLIVAMPLTAPTTENSVHIFDNEILYFFYQFMNHWVGQVDNV